MYTLLNEFLPGIFEKTELDARKDIKLEWMIRRRYKWQLECEGNPESSSKSYYKTLQKLRPYFYSEDEIDSFPDVVFGHHHAADLTNHDDYHNGEFHLHTNGRFPLSANARI